MPSESLPWGVLALAAVGVGAWFCYRGWTLHRQRKLMENTPTDDVWHLDLGPAEITGTANAIDGETLRAPFTEESCLAAEWEIEEWDESGKHSGWETVGSGTVSVSAFEVEDETGTITVRPEGAEFDIDEHAEETIEVGGPDDPPEPVREFLASDATPGASSQPLIEALDWGQQHGDRKYHQHLLKPSEEAYVYGTVHPRDDWEAPTRPEHMEIRKADERAEPMFLVSDRPQDELVRSRTVGLWRIPVGVVLAALGGWMLLAGLGIGV
ncbi:E3 ubiquitin ligase family protein [Halorussus salilacus]|uniref:E3 ubiquitin ligase family protein n=1 Tax=Halorussus salilacus TaxID=2953750 RepID=UPI00209F7D8E|nr:E3 ubiquitin ligase family protein [Halorussus salilacus]USZ67839.1 E3 ubiquitin ligase family protein [Halorussus salilacus]